MITGERQTPLPNWVDLIVVIIIWRACYGGLDRGLFVELLLLASAFVVSAATLNYAGVVAGWARPWLFNDWRSDAVVYALIFLTLLLIFHEIVRSITQRVPMQASNWIVHGGGLIVGAVRGLWWASIVLIVVAGTGIPYFRGAVRERSITGTKFFEASRQVIVQATNYFPGSENRRSDLIPPVMAEKGRTAK